jgi:hypothetical protein
MTDDFAYTAAINVPRDTIESRRLPSGLTLEPDAAALHERARGILRNCGRLSGKKFRPRDPPRSTSGARR